MYKVEGFWRDKLPYTLCWEIDDFVVKPTVNKLIDEITEFLMGLSEAEYKRRVYLQTTTNNEGVEHVKD